MVAAWEWWGSTRGSPATDLKREQGREVVGQGAGRGAVVEAVRQLGYRRRGGLWRSKKGLGG